jgi:hypothetical protein
MKLEELVETAAVGSVATGDVAGYAGILFTRDKRLNHNKSKVGKVPVIKYKNKNNWNLR